MSTSTTYTLTAADVDAILSELAGDWTTEQRHDHYVAAVRADGLALGFHSHTYGPSNGKVEVSLTAPSAHVRYDEKRPTINVTMTRPAKTLAGDIARRLMPDAETYHATIVERVARIDAYNARVSANVELLETVAGVTSYKRGSDDRPSVSFRTPSATVSGGDVYGNAQVGNDYVNLELNSLSPELARQILALALGQA